MMSTPSCQFPVECHQGDCVGLQVVPEPVDKWQNIQDTNGGQPSNLLEAFYRNPERYAYTFQNYVFVTRLMQVRAQLATCQYIKLRSITVVVNEQPHTEKTYCL